MSKKQYIRALNQLGKTFSANPNALEAIDYLLSLCEGLEDESASLKTETFPIPPEGNGRTNAWYLFSDGACRGNPGPGAWATMGQDHLGNVVITASGVQEHTTNNKMELMGAIEGLRQLREIFLTQNLPFNSSVLLFSDSKYLLDGLKSWVDGWKNRGWRKADNKVPENVELWQELDSLRQEFSGLELFWVKGHAGHPQNEYCDKLANDELNINGF